MTRRWPGLLALLVLGSAMAAGDAEPSPPRLAPETAAGRCRAAFPAVAGNPSAPGGWLFDRVSGERILCLYGDIGGSDGFGAALGDAEIDRLVLRSTGGAVAVWLGMAEQLTGRVRRAYIDEACFSSCANYAFPLAHVVEAAEGSLVVWHGGPTLRGLEGWAERSETLDALFVYYDYAVRTEALYRRIGIDVAVLADTDGALPEHRDYRHSGYALPPEVLSRCYGFASVGALWHAGDDAAVAALGRSRSADLDIVAVPRTVC